MWSYRLVQTYLRTCSYFDFIIGYDSIINWSGKNERGARTNKMPRKGKHKDTADATTCH